MTSRIRRQRDRGAAAVEFALVSPLLFMLLFGVIDYGLYMADVLSVQQGVSDAAREATLSVSSVAASWPGSTTCGALAVTPSLAPAATSDLTRVACRVGETVQPLGGGTVVAKAEVVDADGHPTATWALGNRLRVCAVTRHDAVLPFVPLPDGGIVTTRADMPIQPGGVPMLLNPVAQDVTALGTDWSWC